MPLDPQVIAAFERLAGAVADASDPTIDPATDPTGVLRNRRDHNAMARAFAGPPEDVDAVSEVQISPNLRVRIYAPREPRSPAGITVFYHGGGWVVGSLDSYDTICRALCNRSGSVVVSVDYRLAPEHPAPAALDDARDALIWVQTHARELGADPARIAVAGDSAGGNLAALVAVWNRDAGGPPLALQALIYPVTDLARRTWPHIPEAPGFVTELDRLIGLYAGVADRADPALSPLRVASLAQLPTAVVITAEFDPLYEQGEDYARALTAAGVPVVTHRYSGMPHGFMGMRADVDAAETALREVSAALERAFTVAAPPPPAAPGDSATGLGGTAA